MKKNLTVTNMIETLVNYSGDQKELECIWDTLHHMACMGFISHEEWLKFYDLCAGWRVEGDKVIDGDDKVIWTYNCETFFTVDELKKGA